MEQVRIGMEVYSYDTRIGVVESVQGQGADRSTLIIRRDGGLLQAAPAGAYRVDGSTLRVEEAQLRDVIEATGAEQRYAASSYQSVGPAAAQQANVVEDNDELRIPIMEEQVIVSKREVERGGVRVHKRVHQREEVVEQPTFQEQVEVERVEIGQFVDFVPQPREEGDTLIIPILEEVLVVEKRLLVKEEIRITKRRTEETQQARVTLRQEEAVVERIDDPQAGV